MNINTVWSNTIDSISSVKDKVVDKYNSTNMNPFPKNVNVTITIDYEKSIDNLFKALGKVKQKDMDNIAKLGKLVEVTMKKAIK
jgi:hypothetical protein